MQPTMVITAPKPGMIYINGRFSGESSEDLPLMRPVNPIGPLYIEYRPLCPDFLPMARRIVFSGGHPLSESADEAEDLRMVAWPGSITEIELLPAPSAPPSPMAFEAGGRNFIIDSRRRLTQGAQVLAQLPAGAEIPEYRLLTHGGALIGKCSGGMYLLTGSGQMDLVSGFLQAKQIELSPDGRIQALMDHGDLAGHGSLESWRLSAEGLTMISAEPVWANGSPRWPRTALETVCAAVEAQLQGLHAEAEGYLSPSLRGSARLAEIAGRCDLCTEMKYALPDGRPCAALVHLEGGALARAEPLYYRVSASGGAQGPYQIEELTLE